MVLDPKYTSHNDYGTISPTSDQSFSLLSPSGSDRARSPATRPKPAFKMTQDVYQRQPLLPTPKADKWGRGDVDKEFFGGGAEDITDAGDGGPKAGRSTSEIVEVEMPPPVREEPRFPKEKWKTIVAAAFLIFNFFLTTIALAITHDRVPDRNEVPPLPDTFLDTVPALDWALDVSEYIIMLCTNVTVIVLVFHKHRFIVLRRIFLIMGVLYMMRSITMSITVLPISSRTYYCSPKANQTSLYLITSRALQIMSGFGLSVNGKHTYCGDYIYSGHTVTLVLSYLIIAEYSPKKFYLAHWTAWCLAITGVIMVLLAHGHYSVDVIIAYYVTTRLFWTYHTLANNGQLKQRNPQNYLSREWWFFIFQYFEKNIGGPVPRRYDWPLPWPRRFQSKNRDS